MDPLSYQEPWLEDVESRFKMTPDKRQRLPLHGIVENLFLNKDELIDNSDPNKVRDLADKIHKLSEEKLEYYHSSTFGILKQFFSSIRNAWILGTFKSSGQLGLELSTNIHETIVKNSIAAIAFAKPLATDQLEPLLELVETPVESRTQALESGDFDEHSELVIPQADVKEDLEKIESKEVESVPDRDIFFDADDWGDETVVPQAIIDLSNVEFEDEISDEDEDEDEELFDTKAQLDEAAIEQKEKKDPIIDQQDTDLKIDALSSTPIPEIQQPIDLLEPQVKIKPLEGNASEGMHVQDKKPTPPLTPQQEMEAFFQNVWKHANKKEVNYIWQIWSAMIPQTQLVSWKATGKPNEYQLELKKELEGNSSNVPIGRAVLKQKMKIAFSEEKVDETGEYTQVISFPDQGVCHRLGNSWISLDTPLERIVIRDYKNYGIYCTVEALGHTIIKSAKDTLTFWQETKWNE